MYIKTLYYHQILQQHGLGDWQECTGYCEQSRHVNIVTQAPQLFTATSMLLPVTGHS